MPSSLKLVPPVLIHLSFFLIGVLPCRRFHHIRFALTEVVKIAEKFMRVEIMPFKIERSWDFTAIVNLSFFKHGE